MKKLFSTPKRAVVTVICMVIVIAAVAAIAVKSTLITGEEAKAVALGDAGLSETEASALRARLEFDDGRFQYEVDFYSNGIEYEYLIQAKDGDIIARDIEGGAYDNHYGQDRVQDTGNQTAAVENHSAQPREDAENRPAEAGNDSAQPGENAENRSAEAGNHSAQPLENAENVPGVDENHALQPQGISLDEAKAAALEDAGLAEAEVTFKKAELDHDKGMQVYEIKFYTSDTEYDYKINASDRTVIEKSVELFRTQANPAGSAADSPNNNYIGVDQAKDIALNHANLSESDVQFEKVKLEKDGGRAEYEVEFYSGRTEYDYTIDAVSGSIVEYDVDYN